MYYLYWQTHSELSPITPFPLSFTEPFNLFYLINELLTNSALMNFVSIKQQFLAKKLWYTRFTLHAQHHKGDSVATSRWTTLAVAANVLFLLFI